MWGQEVIDVHGYANHRINVNIQVYGGDERLCEVVARVLRDEIEQGVVPRLRITQTTAVLAEARR